MFSESAFSLFSTTPISKEIHLSFIMNPAELANAALEKAGGVCTFLARGADVVVESVGSTGL